MLAQLIAFVTGHEVILASLCVALLDLIFALSPSASSNGLLHWLYQTLSNILKPAAAK